MQTLTILFQAKNDDPKTRSEVTVFSDYGPCYKIQIRPGKITVASSLSILERDVNSDTVQIRQWDGHGLYVNSKRVGPTCPLTVSLGGKERMDVAAMKIKSDTTNASISFTFPHRPLSLSGNDSARMHRILNGDHGVGGKKSFNYNTIQRPPWNLQCCCKLNFVNWEYSNTRVYR